MLEPSPAPAAAPPSPDHAGLRQRGWRTAWASRALWLGAGATGVGAVAEGVLLREHGLRVSAPLLVLATVLAGLAWQSSLVPGTAAAPPAQPMRGTWGPGPRAAGIGG